MAEEEDTFSLNLFAPAIHPLRRHNYLLLSSAQRISRLHGYKYETFLHRHKKLTRLSGFLLKPVAHYFIFFAIQPNYMQHNEIQQKIDIRDISFDSPFPNENSSTGRKRRD
ncbi:hypothetical protein CEXT_46691 [Caerostris extrusa]|uniref:Uncharacterized protein n=1 Tax=Caerostris extrusa TaxID=172846 RepID=A0AAV4MUI7_CAEEX|nr:hypothetical protein CEXT_46691 [Caerostris extrusa]